MEKNLFLLSNVLNKIWSHCENNVMSQITEPWFEPRKKTPNFCIEIARSEFLFLAGIKCTSCGSYNTVRDKGPLVRLRPRNGDAATAAGPSTTEGEGGGASASQEGGGGTLTPPPSSMGEDEGASSRGTLTPPETPNREDHQMSEEPVSLGRYH